MTQLLKYILASLGLLLSSCTERIDVDLPTSLDRLVVDGKLSIDTMQHTVILSKTMDYFTPNPEIPYISGAKVQITEVETGKVYSLQQDPYAPGHYRTIDNIAGIQGYNYTLEIDGVDIDEDGTLERYEATDYLPYITDKIDSIKLVYGYSLSNELIGMPQSEYKGWNTLLYMQDLPTHEYYIISSERNDITFSHLRDKGFFDDIMFGAEGSNVYLNGAPMSFMSDSTDYQTNIGDTIGLTVQSTSKRYFQYLLDVKNANAGGNPMMGNPANVRGNINNGAVGYFATYSARASTETAK